MSGDKLKFDIPDDVIESLARCILPSIRAYFESEGGQKEFSEWIEKRRWNRRVAGADKFRMYFYGTSASI